MRKNALAGIVLSLAIIGAAAFAVAQQDNQDSITGGTMIEQVIEEKTPTAGFVAHLSETDSHTAKGAARTPFWMSGSVMLMALTVVLVVLVGYLAGTYHREAIARKGSFGHGLPSHARILRTSQAFCQRAASHARKAGRFFSGRRTRPQVKAHVSRELDAYLKNRQMPEDRMASTAKPQRGSVSSYEDEYWKRQKERFWNRVQRAAGRPDSSPQAIQQLAVRQVQQYNEAMAQVRQAKEDLYDTRPAGTQDSGGNGAASHHRGRDAPAASTVVQRQSILNQLKEAHSI